MNSVSRKNNSYSRGYSLAEVLAALVIGAMVLVAVLGIYHRSESLAASVTARLEGSQLADEVLQLMTGDLEKVTACGRDVKIIIENKLDNLYPAARLQIINTIYDSSNNKQTFEKIVWQASYDYETTAKGLILYRSYSGMALEDKLLDRSRSDLESDRSFVPICTGVTLFRIEVPQREELLQQWNVNSLPAGVVVSLSFAEPFKTASGSFDVYEEDKVTRSIAIDRTRIIAFSLAEIDVNDLTLAAELEDANQQDEFEEAEPNEQE